MREPTAPFHEAAVRAAIAALLADCPRVQVREDDFGNLIAHYRGPVAAADRPAPARYAFCAHMDHPGWVAARTTRTGRAVGAFLGGVPPEYQEANRERVRDFGAFAMWDLPAFELRDGRIYSRACDDLIGCAVDRGDAGSARRAAAPGECYGLFTRAEEVGFAGAIEMARAGWLAGAGRDGDFAGNQRRAAARADGRRADRARRRQDSVFDPAVTAELVAAAAEAGIAVQRCLMSGGTCEATAFRLYGVRCGALCVALGNYHNLRPRPAHRAGIRFAGRRGRARRRCASALATPGRAALPDPDAALRARLENNLLAVPTLPSPRPPSLSPHP